MTKFPDISQMAKIPWHFFKIPWQFPDLEKILFFPDFSPTRGNPEIVQVHKTACDGLDDCYYLTVIFWNHSHVRFWSFTQMRTFLLIGDWIIYDLILNFYFHK